MPHGAGHDPVTDHDFSRRIHELIPGGAHTYSRGDDQFPLAAPRALTRGKGARVWDLNGREYVDWGMGIQNVLIGHAEEAIDDAAIDALRGGQAFSRPSSLELTAAEAVLGLFPDMDMVKFAKGGSDANTAAIRLARAITRRDLIAFDATAPFLSIHDWFIGTTAMSAGVPRTEVNLSIPFSYNDIGSIRDVFAAHPQRIAAVIMEVCRETTPAPGFLTQVRQLCDAEGTLLIFDEVITGFRYHLNGAHVLFDVVPDLMTVGKGMGNGYAISAVLGKREHMERGGLRHHEERVFFLSTTNGPERSALAACAATVAFYRAHPVIERIAASGREFMSEANAAARRHGIENALFARSDFDCRPLVHCLDASGAPSAELRTLFLQETARAGIIVPWACPSFRHGPAEMEVTAEALDRAAAAYALALERGTARGLIDGPVVRPVFRSYN